jgi:hypothetical protein
MACGRLYPYDGIKGIGGHDHQNGAQGAPRMYMCSNNLGDLFTASRACIESLYFPVPDKEKDRLISEEREEDYIKNENDGIDDIYSWDIGSFHGLEDGIIVHMIPDHVLKYWTDGQCETDAYW